MGGGTGLFTALSGLRRHDVELTAIVTMADSGGSSGRLRDEFGTLPAGDVRRCLVALAADDSVGMILRQLFEYRFDRGEGLTGHSFGNLLLTALAGVTGGMDAAIREAARLLRVKGTVLPVTLTNSHLHAVLVDGRVLSGERAIDLRRESVPIDRVYLDPPAEATAEALAAIAAADLVVIGPGDLYTSIAPNLLVRGIREAIAASPAQVVYVCNLMTKHGETDGFAASDFLRVANDYLGDGVLDTALLNYYEWFPRDILQRYRQEHAEPVSIDPRSHQYGVRLVVRSLAAAGTYLRHDPDRLAQAIVELLRHGGTPVPTGTSDTTA